MSSFMSEVELTLDLSPLSTQCESWWSWSQSDRRLSIGAGRQRLEPEVRSDF